MQPRKTAGAPFARLPAPLLPGVLRDGAQSQAP
jgi:hypothetical protein